MRMLCFDQALANTGWAYMNHDLKDGWGLLATGTLKTDADKTGSIGNIKRSVKMYEMMKSVLTDHPMSDVVIHELPTVGFGMFRPESCLSAAISLQIAVSCLDTPIPVHVMQRQRVNKHLTGHPNSDKKTVGAAVEKRLVDQFSNVLQSRRNEHIRDAIALGIVWLEQGNH